MVIDHEFEKQLIELLYTQELDGALELLDKQNISKEALHYWYGIIAFKKERYKESADRFEKALIHEPDDELVKSLLFASNNNWFSEIHEFIPEIIYNNKNDLLKAAVDPKFPKLIAQPTNRSIPNIIQRRISNILGLGVGGLISLILDVTTISIGTFLDFRDEIWTNWYRKNKFLGILILAYMRDKLNANNLISAYRPDEFIGFNPKVDKIPENVEHFRTADGSWNNLHNPKEGAAGTRFLRNVNEDSYLKENPVLEPNPRKISRILLTRIAELKEVPYMNLLSVAWIQFQVHDWVSHGENLQLKTYDIPLAKDDPARIKFHQTHLYVGRSQLDPTQKCKNKVSRSFINEVTHWWDGSQIYGSDRNTLDGLRSFENGEMKISDEGLLPRNTKGVEKTGFVRNWWVGLSLLHTLFVKEHNVICTMLGQRYPASSDEQIFQTARLINSALIAKIHTLEWNSAINPNEVIYHGNHSNWYGLLTTLIRSKKNWKTVANFNIRNTESGGVVGNPIRKYGNPFGLTQEFVEVYRLHSMLPENLHIQSLDKTINEFIPFTKSRQVGASKLVDDLGIENLFYSFGNQLPGQLVLNNYPAFMQNLSIPGNPVYDMGAVDLLRSRERGVPRYNEFRRQLGLHPIKSFGDLTSDKSVITRLKECYGEDQDAVEKLDLMIGSLAEEKRPTNFAFGETTFQLFLLNATRRLQADRFYTTCYSEKYYTKEGMEWIDSNTLKSVILRHYPQLKNSGLNNINNAFEPWDDDRQLDPLRHPLRAFDPDTKNDPWKGSAH